jgi:hypothetical protein
MASVAIYPVGQQDEQYYGADRWNGPDEWGMEDNAWSRRETVRPSQCLVRAFPNEDISLWTKPEIDNGRVVRQNDPKAVSDCWKSLSAAAAVVLLAVGLLLPKAYGLISGMQLEQLRQRQVDLQERLRVVTLDENRVASPERIEKLAMEFGFRPPTAERVARLTMPSARSVETEEASNRH